MIARFQILALKGCNLNRALRLRAMGLVALACLFGASGCSGDEIKWTEEVKLHDGKIIQLKRRAELTESGFPVQQRGFQRFYEFCYAPMGVYWKSHAKYPPEVFDIVDGQAYAKVSVGDCEVCKLHGYPETDALYFSWSGRSWTKIEQKDFPAQLRLNLLMNPKGRSSSEDVRGVVSLAEKENRDPSIHYSLKATGARGLNELPARRGMCKRCRTVNVITKEIPDVFLPSDRKSCD